MESDLLIGSEDMAGGATSQPAEPRYRAVGNHNGLHSAASSSTDEEMIDVTTNTRFNEYSDMVDKSQGQCVVIFRRVMNDKYCDIMEL